MSFEFLRKNKIEKIFLLFSLFGVSALFVSGCPHKEEVKPIVSSQENKEAPCDQNIQEVYTKYPQKTISIEMGFPRRVELSHNSPSEILKEVTDIIVLRQIGQTVGVSEKIIENIKITYNPEYKWIELYWNYEDRLALESFAEKIEDYVNSRKNGHTVEYTLVSMETHNNLENIADPDLKNLLTKMPELPALWLKKIDRPEEEGQFSDEAGNKLRSVVFHLTDGDIVWSYILTYKADGTLDWSHEERCDAKEYDPKYQDVIRETNKKVSEEMERKGIKGLGSCHSFWELKKKYLKAKGIDWRSPSELNPNTMYD